MTYICTYLIANRSKASSITFGDSSAANEDVPPVFKTPQKQILKENNGLNNGVGSDQQGVIKDLRKQLTAETQEKTKLKNEMDKMESRITQFKDKLQVSFLQTY